MADTVINRDVDDKLREKCKNTFKALVTFCGGLKAARRVISLLSVIN